MTPELTTHTTKGLAILLLVFVIWNVLVLVNVVPVTLGLGSLEETSRLLSWAIILGLCLHILNIVWIVADLFLHHRVSWVFALLLLLAGLPLLIHSLQYAMDAKSLFWLVTYYFGPPATLTLLTMTSASDKRTKGRTTNP